MSMRSVVLSPVVLGAAGVLALAGCGSSSKTSTPNPSPTTAAPAASPSSAPAAAGQEPLVKTKSDAKLGSILADGSGKTLYTLTNNGVAVACTGPCITAWPPLEVPAGATTPSGGAGVTGLGTADGPDGTHLVTAGGLPLYRFVKDADEADAYGEGIQSFGGTWHVVHAG